MPAWLGLVILVVAVASRPIEARLWRAGRLSDRAATVLLLGRFPVLVTIAVLATGGVDILGVAIIATSFLSPALFYNFTLGVLRRQRIATAKSRDIQ